MELPKLPALDNKADLQKLFYSEEANWVVPGKVLVGKNPNRSKSKDTNAYIKDLSTNAKITTYVCLQAEVEPQCLEESEIIPGGIQIGNEVDKLPSYGSKVKHLQPNSRFVFYGMKDDEIANNNDSLLTLVENLKKKVLLEQEVLYIHCKGGSGRTGLVAACLLGILYDDMNVDTVLERIQKYFQLRQSGVGKWVNPKMKSPATLEQKQQVRDILNSYFASKQAVGEEEKLAQESDKCNFACIMM